MLVRKAAVEPGSSRSAAFASARSNASTTPLPTVSRISVFSTWCCGLRGRDFATRKKAGEHIFKALSAYLDPVFAGSKFALSFDMQINDKETSWKRNNTTTFGRRRPRMDKVMPKSSDVFQANRDRAAPLLKQLRADGIGHMIDGRCGVDLRRNV